MAEIISGKQLSKEIREDVRLQVEALQEKYGTTPHLAVVLIGDDPASQSYVRAKERACKKAAINSSLYHLPKQSTEQEVLELIEKLNQDNSVHGILVQLPLPSHMDENKVIDAIAIEKDVDGFTPLNVAYLHLGRPATLPATPKGIMTMIDSVGIDLEGKNALVIGRSNIVGKPLAAMLLARNATVTIAHSRTRNLKEKCLQSDIVVAAVGKPNIVTADMIKNGAVVIDVGVNRVGDKLVGDCDFEAVKEKASYITPVPGGVGPMTITSLLQNTIECFVRIQND